MSPQPSTASPVRNGRTSTSALRVTTSAPSATSATGRRTSRRRRAGRAPRRASLRRSRRSSRSRGRRRGRGRARSSRDPRAPGAGLRPGAALRPRLLDAARELRAQLRLPLARHGAVFAQRPGLSSVSMPPETRYARSGDAQHRLPGRRRRPDRPRLRARLGLEPRGIAWEEPAMRALPRAPRVLLPPDPLRQARHRPLRPRVERTSCRRSRSGWTTCAPSSTRSARSAPRSSGTPRAGTCAFSSPPRIRSGPGAHHARLLRQAPRPGRRLPVGVRRPRTATRRRSTSSANWGHLRPADVEYYAPSRVGRRAVRAEPRARTSTQRRAPARRRAPHG